MRQSDLRVLALIGTFGFLAQHTFAATITDTYSGGFPATIRGTLPNQGTALLENFTLPSSSNLTITTTSYASGGFEPNLLLSQFSGQFRNVRNPIWRSGSSNRDCGRYAPDCAQPTGRNVYACTY